MRFRLVPVLIPLLLAGCFKFDARSRKEKDEGAAKEVQADQNGVVTSRYDAQQKSAFEVTAKDSGAISGAGISIPAGALSIDTDVTLEEGGSIVSDATAQSLGIDGQGVAAAGPAVLFGASDPNAKLSGNVAITLPLGDQESALALAACANYTVFYKIKDAAGVVTAGAYPSSALTPSETNIKFNATGFGVFQAACIGKAIETAISKVTTEPILSKRDESALAAVTFTVSDPVYFEATRSFDVTISAGGLASDAKCLATIDQDKASPSDKIVDFTPNTTLVVAAMSDAAHSVYVRASCYEASNGRSSRSAWSKELAFPVKPAPPPPAVAAFTSPAADSYINIASDAAHFIFSGTCSPVGEALTLQGPGSLAATTTCGTNSQWAVEVDASGADLDPAVFSITPATNASGGATLSLKRDLTAPLPPSGIALGSGTVTDDETPTLSWTSVADAAKYEVKYGTVVDSDNRGVVSNITTLSDTYAGAAPDTTNLHARVRAYDLAGNVSPWSSSASVQFDTSAPVVSATVATSATPGGKVDLTVTMDGDVSGLTELKIVRKYGMTAANDCTSGVPVYTEANPSNTETVVDLVGGRSATKHSYTFCVTDGLARTTIFKRESANAVTPSFNPAPACRFPPCDLAKSSAAATLGGPSYLGAGTSIATNADFRTAVLGDLDQDGDLDVVFAAHNSNGLTSIPIQSVLNNGSGVFGSPADVDSGVNLLITNHLLLADFNKDGDLDLVSGGNIYYGTNGANTATFAAPVALPTGCASGWTTAADVTFDGRLDLLCASTDTKVFPRKADGTFDNPFILGDGDVEDSVTSHGVVVGDVNGDHLPDVVVAKDNGGASGGGFSRVYVNASAGLAGVGGFNLQATAVMVTKAISLADLDADGDLDYVVFNGNGQGNFHFLNDGTGHPTAVTQDGTAFTTGSTSVELGVLANFIGAANQFAAIGFGGGICRADWSTTVFGGSVAASSNTDAAFGGDVGDLNADGKLDVVAAFYGFSTARDVRVYMSP